MSISKAQKNPASLNESDLINLLIEQEEIGFDYLYKHYSAALYGIILRIIGDEDIADEILHDSLIKIYNNIDRYDPVKGRLFTWMMSICRRMAIDKTRSKEMSQARKSFSIDHIIDIDAKATSYIPVDDIGVRQLTEHLNDHEKQIVDLVYFGGYTHIETAETLGIPLGTVKTRVRRALIILRKVLNVN